MKWVNKYWIAGLFFLLGTASLIGFNLIGSYIDENNILREPFALIPLFWIFQCFAVIAFIVTFLRDKRRERRVK